MKKAICLLFILILTVLCVTPFFSACAAKDDGKLKVVCTTFSLCDWAMNVLGERASEAHVTLLQDSGADLHSYQPTVADLAAIAESDVFVYVGGESDDWIKDALRSVNNKKMIAVDLLSVLGDGAVEEEIVEGMEHEHQEDHEEDGELDEHVWLSLRNAALFTQAIANALCKADEAGADIYKENAKTYIESLNALDVAYAAEIEAAPRDTLIFGDRFPFRYLVKDYGLKYYAAFAGCAAESEASFETIRFLASKADELSLKVILKLENSKSDIARGIKEASASKNQSIMVLDSLQSANKKEYANGRNYLSVMTSNLEVLKTALAE